MENYKILHECIALILNQSIKTSEEILKILNDEDSLLDDNQIKLKKLEETRSAYHTVYMEISKLWEQI